MLVPLGEAAQASEHIRILVLTILDADFGPGRGEGGKRRQHSIRAQCQQVRGPLSGSQRSPVTSACFQFSYGGTYRHQLYGYAILTSEFLHCIENTDVSPEKRSKFNYTEKRLSQMNPWKAACLVDPEPHPSFNPLLNNIPDPSASSRTEFKA